VDPEAMQVFATPGKNDLKNLMELGDAGVA
jgi:hypothetical protein